MSAPHNFALIGAAGFVAPRHMKAIVETGNRLVCALDRSDSVGILDRFSFDVPFFTEFERFDRHAERLRRQGDDARIRYVSICSPNYLHDAHIRFALRIGADAICEKPLVLNPWNVDALAELEAESGRRVYNVLQLRLHPAIQQLKERIAREPGERVHDVDLSYVTARGRWYFVSWKGDLAKSGGIATNIGIHFFDTLLWLFGPVRGFEVHVRDDQRAAGFLELARARVRWFLSVSASDLPSREHPASSSAVTTFRSMEVDGTEFEFSDGFTDLHTATYREVLEGRGFGLEEARPSVELAHHIRHAVPVMGSSETKHPWLDRR